MGKTTFRLHDLVNTVNERREEIYALCQRARVPSKMHFECFPLSGHVFEVPNTHLLTRAFTVVPLFNIASSQIGDSPPMPHCSNH